MNSPLNIDKATPAQVTDLVPGCVVTRSGGETGKVFHVEGRTEKGLLSWTLVIDWSANSRTSVRFVYKIIKA